MIFQELLITHQAARSFNCGAGMSSLYMCGFSPDAVLSHFKSIFHRLIDGFKLAPRFECGPVMDCVRPGSTVTL